MGERKIWKTDGHSLEIDFSEHWVKLDGELTELTLAEWNILSILARNGRNVTTRERLLGEALDYAHDGSERAVITHVSNLRAKLSGTEWIETVRGLGYRFRGDE
jgi:DNA-binding response OmpR family regulator